MKLDYQTWKLQGKEYLEVAGISLLVTTLINLMCYRRWWAFLLGPPVFIICQKQWKEEQIRKRKALLYDHFRDLIACLHTALRSGYSLENAVAEAAVQMEQTFGREDVLVRELKEMRHQMTLSIPVEALFADLAKRSRLEDVETFASVLVITKRTGGNTCEVFQNTWDIFCTKIDTMREIRAGAAARAYEQKIMSMVPFGILLYVQVSFPEFLEVMYGNLFGVLFMSVCLAVYLAAWYLGRKILDFRF